MIRLPDWLYRPLERAYFAQRRIRRQEQRHAMDLADRIQRAHYDRLRARHAAGTCGGADGGCCYVPCVPRVS